MGIEYIDLNDPGWGFTFSTCVRAGDFLFTSHHEGYNFEENRWPESIEDQTMCCFINLKRSLEAAGATSDDVVKTTVYLKKIADFDRMREVYHHQFSKGYPARMTAVSEFVVPECLVMIEAIAYMPR
jgi:2-iminobutanoate/2-iminopropanoate deaminase